MGAETASAAYAARLRALGLEVDVREFPDGTHTAQDAADALGCDVAAIVKSLVFTLDGEPLLVLTSGANRVDVEVLGARLGGVIGKADARLVKQATGFSIGAVPPLAHATELAIVVDEDLLALEVAWAAAGSATSVFAIDPRRLAELSGGRVMRVS